MNQPNDCTSKEWQYPTTLPTLDLHRVHVWRARLDLTDAEVAQLITVLSSDEVARANRFRFPRHRRRFIVARGILRQLLGNYLNIEPKELQFDYSDRGKPLLKAHQSDYLQFNLSHSHEYALYGFTYHYPIGVDLEYLREVSDIIKIARRFFSNREYEILIGATNETRPQLFFQLWTAKEAYLKAIGTGLTDSLADIEIALDDMMSSTHLTLKDSTLGARWSLRACTPVTGYIASVAIKTTPILPIDFWHWH